MMTLQRVSALKVQMWNYIWYWTVQVLMDKVLARSASGWLIYGHVQYCAELLKGILGDGIQGRDWHLRRRDWNGIGVWVAVAGLEGCSTSVIVILVGERVRHHGIVSCKANGQVVKVVV
jgi:hypothetical protein